MNLASKRKLSFGWLVVGLNLLCLIFLLVLIWNGYRRSVALRNDYQKLNDARAEAVERQRWENLLQATAAERTILHNSIVSENSLPDVIDKLERLGDQTGAKMEISSVTPGDNNNVNLKLTLTASGAYRELIQLVSLVENFPYQLRIIHSDFRRPNSIEKKNPPDWQVRLGLELFQLKEI